MIKSITFFALTTLGAILTGCAAPGPQFTGLQGVPQGSAELIVYRKSALFASGHTMPLLIDGNKVGELYNGSYFQQQLSPGNHSIKVTTGGLGKSAEATVQLAPGARKFLHLDFPTGPLANSFFVGVTLEERGEAMALEDLKNLSSAKPPAAVK
ncbi:MAG: hypothetical protein A2140_02770 [Candidatus Muproteobacteria bacterium RBG_16_62_13]|uniref:DUF2846 domain-containing protein n=1 Tax=Candidatus Muproteobacteria bacterium RBG_16_62_13 TaxID=1817756 RepID=A0A1F6T893_9PROT|nr:MAG: hypothetical protein A2140_02770 [Candidatus Muproteobacteria bacterium RBG_16_62_13]